MKTKMTIAVSAAALTLLSGTSTLGDFYRVQGELHDTSECPRTYRVYAHFTDPNDVLLGVGSLQHFPLSFWSNVPLFNDGGAFSGFQQEDTAAAPISGPRDSWVTIGASELAGNDTTFTPGFLSGESGLSVIHGSSFSESDGGWFDSNPSTPVKGTKILIAQFSVEEGGYPSVNLEGGISWKSPNGQLHEDEFCCTFKFAFPCLADLDLSGKVDFQDLLILLANWGPCQDGCCLGNQDGDDEVAFADLLALLADWGPCPTP